MKVFQSLGLLALSSFAATTHAAAIEQRQYGLPRNVVRFAPGQFPTTRTSPNVFLTAGRCNFVLTDQCILQAVCQSPDGGYGQQLGGSGAWENTFCAGHEYGELIFQAAGEFYIVRYVGGVEPRVIWLTYTDNKGVAYVEFADTQPFLTIIGQDGSELYSSGYGSPPPDPPIPGCPFPDPNMCL